MYVSLLLKSANVMVGVVRYPVTWKGRLSFTMSWMIPWLVVILVSWSTSRSTSYSQELSGDQDGVFSPADKSRWS